LRQVSPREQHLLRGAGKQVSTAFVLAVAARVTHGPAAKADPGLAVTALGSARISLPMLPPA